MPPSKHMALRAWRNSIVGFGVLILTHVSSQTIIVAARRTGPEYAGEAYAGVTERVLVQVLPDAPSKTVRYNPANPSASPNLPFNDRRIAAPSGCSPQQVTK